MRVKGAQRLQEGFLQPLRSHLKKSRLPVLLQTRHSLIVYDPGFGVNVRRCSHDGNILFSWMSGEFQRLVGEALCS